LYNGGITRNGFILGAFMGLASGGISSMIQTQLMILNRKNMRWISYNTISWTIVFALGWAISWDKDVAGLASGAAAILIGVGISLAIFLSNNPDIEFS